MRGEEEWKSSVRQFGKFEYHICIALGIPYSWYFDQSKDNGALMLVEFKANKFK